MTKLKLEFAVLSDQIAKVTEAILRTAEPGNSAGGEMFVFDLDQALITGAGETPEIVLRRAA